MTNTQAQVLSSLADGSEHAVTNVQAVMAGVEGDGSGAVIGAAQSLVQIAEMAKMLRSLTGKANVALPSANLINNAKKKIWGRCWHGGQGS